MKYEDIKATRLKYKISQTKLAEYSGYTKSKISRWELQKEIPSENEVQHLKDVLDELIPQIESGNLNLTGHRLTNRERLVSNSKSQLLIKDANDYQQRIAALNYKSSYSRELTHLYQNAMASKDEKSIKGIGLFSGCGGLDLGFAAAGVKIVGHVEIWDAANKIYAQNFPDSSLLKKDINNISEEDIFNWKKQYGTIDIIVGGPPCQGFSLAGKRDPEDMRNRLYKQYVRVVAGLHPKAFVFENVAKLTSMKNQDGSFFIDEILREFSEVGYSLSYQIVNASDYGVPQSRERVIIVGVRRDLGKQFSFRAAPYGQADDSGQMHVFDSKKSIRSFRVATEDLETLENGEVSKNDPLHWAIVHPQHVIDWLIDVPEGQSAHENPDPTKRPPSGFNTTYKRIIWDEPCSTISTNFSMISGCRNVHPSSTRSLTIREATRAQSFPDEFVFCGKWGDIRKAIGNAVPPILAYEIAQEIIQQIFEV